VVAAAPRCEAEPAPPLPPASPFLNNCPECDAELALLRIIPGRAAEYWAMRCTGCGGIHLNIVETTAPAC
jgi:hypothetical protein